MKIITKNKKAFFNFAISEFFEAGIMLVGTEVKSIRNAPPNLTESYVNIDNKDELYVYNINIPHYTHGNINNHLENRKRKLLLNKAEIIKIKKLMSTQALSLIPTKMYFKNSRVKLEIGLGKGKKLHDKRQDQMKKDVEKKLRQKNFD